MSDLDHAYVSVLQWAEGSQVHDQVEAVVASCAIDPYDAELKVRKGVPQVLARTEGAMAQTMLEEFSRRGVLAFAPLRRELAGAGDAPRIKRLMAMHDGTGYVCEMWRGEGTAFKLSDIFCMIRAKLRSSETSSHYEKGRHSVVRGYMLGGSIGAIGARVANSYSSGQVKSSRVSTTDILDLYFRDGRRLRLDADKLNFDVLADERGYADHVNMGLLSDRLRSGAPRAMFDEGFRNFVCPMEFSEDRVRASGKATVRTRTEGGAFEFYSVWAYLMYAHLLGGDGATG